MRSFLSAWTMLTALPAPFFRATEKDLNSAANFFPLVGLIYGAALYGAGILLAPFPRGVAALVLTLAAELGTRMLHLDGAADTADAFFSSRPKERKLEIMRDSHVGTMGVFAIFALLAARIIFLSAAPDGKTMAIQCALAAFAGRCAITVYICASSYARPDGSAAPWFRRRPYPGALLGLIGLALTALLPAVGIAAAGFGVALILPLFWSRITRHVIGGATGDTIGACEEMTETAVLFALICIFTFVKSVAA